MDILITSLTKNLTSDPVGWFNTVKQNKGNVSVYSVGKEVSMPGFPTGVTIKAQ